MNQSNVLRNDVVSTIFLLITIFLAIYYSLNMEYSHNAGYWLFACVLYIYRGIVWEGAYVKRIRDLEEVIRKLSE